MPAVNILVIIILILLADYFFTHNMIIISLIKILSNIVNSGLTFCKISITLHPLQKQSSHGGKQDGRSIRDGSLFRDTASISRV